MILIIHIEASLKDKSRNGDELCLGFPIEPYALKILDVYVEHLS